MANGRGYLGKISAIVSANTGDYVRKLDDSAKRTAAFARTIQSDLTRASREASRSIDAILTPLQRFERAIQNAASARLKFRGVDVAVRTIEDLRRSLAALDSDQEKEFAVRVSGLRNITELKNVLTDIREEDIDLAVNVGGVEGLRRLRNQVREVNGEQINIRTGESPARLEALIQKFSRLSPSRIREISIAVEARQLDAAILKERQLVSLAKEIAAPLSASVAQFDKLTLEVQAGFIPALSAAQSRVEAVRDRIEAGGQVGERAFRRIADEVRQTTEAIGRLAEAQRLVQSIGTGRSLRETSPRQFDALARAAEQSRRSEQVSAQVAAQFGLGDRQQRVGNLAGQVSVLQARRESQEQDLIAAKKAKNSTLEAEIQRRLQLTIQYEARKTAELERQLGLQLNQIEAAERLDEAQRGSASSPFASFRDPQGRPLAERFREQARVRAEEERRADIAADQQRRREVATTFLPPVIDLPQDPRQASLERTQALADRLGPDIASSASALARLESSTVSLKAQINQLPEPVRAQFIPALREAENTLLRLAASDDATPEDIERAANEALGLEQNLRRASSAADAFGGTFADFADKANFQSAGGRLQFLRQELLKANGDTTKAEAAVNKLATAFRSAARVPGGFSNVIGQLNEVEREAVEAVAAVRNVRPSTLAERTRRAGDVARGAFGNTGLAIQQAIFAFDDFFSVTGDLSQRIRAAGNNLSQLGFIIGGTAGLVTGVLVSAFAQGAVALINWANAGVEGQDRTRALNDVLAEQQSIVDKLAESFANLGRSISLSAFSGGARDAEEFRRQIQELRDEQQEQLRGRAASLDPTVVRERALQNARRRELERTSSIGEAVLIQREIEQSRIRERAAANAAFSRPAIAPADVRNQIADEIQALEFRRQEDIRNALPEGDSAAARAESRAAAARARQQFLDTTGVPRDARAAEDLVRRRIDELAERRRQTSSFRSPLERIAIDSQAQANAQRLNALQRDRVVQEAEAQVTVIEQIRAFAIAIQQAQDSVSDAIRQGVPNSVEFSRQLIEAANAVSRAEQQFREAGEAVLDAIELPTGTEAERRDRDVAIAAAAQRQAEARGAVEAAQVRAAALEQAANDVRRRAIIDPQDTLDATLARARENLDRAGLPAGSLARDLRILQSQRDAISREVDDPRTTDERRKALDQELIAVNENIRAIERASLALRAFSDGLNRASQNAEANLQSAQQDADEARRRDISIGTPRTRGDRESADRALARQREAQRRAEREIEIARGRLEQRVTDRALALGLDDPFGRIRDINNELASGRNLGPDGRAALLNERERLQAALQDIINQFDATAVRLGDAEERVRQFAVSVALGRELIRTEAERAGEALRVRLQAVRDAFQEQAQGQAVDAAAQQAALGRVFADDVRQVAPLRVQFGEEIANAIQQGPSRAALQVSDTTTVEGQRELNRLLRGDDPATDINLAELQRQTRALEELVRIWRELGVEN